jgi:hypothetical protein
VVSENAALSPVVAASLLQSGQRKDKVGLVPLETSGGRSSSPTTKEQELEVAATTEKSKEAEKIVELAIEEKERVLGALVALPEGSRWSGKTHMIRSRSLG